MIPWRLSSQELKTVEGKFFLSYYLLWTSILYFHVARFNGKFLKRHRVPKPKVLVTPGDVSYYTIDDFYSGVEIEMYSRIYTVVDCDDATKKYLEERGTPFGPLQPLPKSVYDPTKRSGATRGSSR